MSHDGIAPDEQPLTGDGAEAEKAARPPHGADDGRRGGRSLGGQPGAGTFAQTGGAGGNAQRGGPAGVETDADAPGVASHKKSDDAK